MTPRSGDMGVGVPGRWGAVGAAEICDGGTPTDNHLWFKYSAAAAAEATADEARAGADWAVYEIMTTTASALPEKTNHKPHSKPATRAWQRVNPLVPRSLDVARLSGTRGGPCTNTRRAAAQSAISCSEPHPRPKARQEGGTTMLHATREATGWWRATHASASADEAAGALGDPGCCCCRSRLLLLAAQTSGDEYHPLNW